MKTRGCIKTLLVMSVILMCLSLLNQARGQESVKITQDQFELRSDPENNDENVIGTLRLNTPVVLTGKTSGQWREVRAPNGQTGWVHEAGLSLPKRAEKPAPTPKPEQTKPPKRATPKPAKTQAATSRAVPRSPAAQPDKPAKATGKVDDLQKANSQYKAQLDEKERRIAELTTELEAVEAKLVEAGQSLSDAEQQSKLGDVKFKEIQAQIDALNEMMKQKEEELLTEKFEKTKLQEQINALTAAPPSSSLQRALLLVSLPLNLLAVLLLGYFGVRHIARKQEKQLIEESESHIEHVAPITPEPKRPSEAAAHQPADSVKIQISKESDPGLHELDVVMTTPDKSVAPVEPSEAVEEVVIDLGDVLPGAKPPADVPQAAPVLPHKKTEPIAKPVEAEEEIIIVDEPIEPALPEAAAPPQIEPAEAILIEEEIEETQIEEPAAQEAEMEEALLEELDEPLAPGDQAEIEPPAPAPAAPVYAPVEMLLDEELDDIPMTPIESEVEEPVEEAIEELAEPLQIEEDMGALEMELEDEELDLSAETPVTEAIEETDEEPVELDGDLDALLENTPKLDHTASVEDVLEEGELEELPPPEVEIDGERFETIPKKHTQPIEIAEQEEEMFDETPAESAPVEEEASEMEEILLDSGPGVIDEPLPEPETGVSKSIVRDEASAQPEAAEPSFANLRANQEIDELISMFGERHPERPEKRSESRLHPSRRRFAEPSPQLVEPEHETESAETDRHSGKCTIELVQVGKNREHILHILSKIQGLAKSPEELIASTPCTLARGAEKQDAQNFQMLMQKFGAEVRVIER